MSNTRLKNEYDIERLNDAIKDNAGMQIHLFVNLSDDFFLF